MKIDINIILDGLSQTDLLELKNQITDRINKPLDLPSMVKEAIRLAHIDEFGRPSKISAVRMLREHSGLDLHDAKKAIDKQWLK